MSRLSPAGDRWVLGAILATAAVAAVALVPLVAVAVRPDVTVSIRDGVDDVAATDAASPRERVGTVSVTSTANAYMGPTASFAVVSGHCIASTTTPVYAVEEGATGTSDGDGPYCTDTAACPAGAVIPLGGRIWARTASGSSTLRCRWRDDGASAAALVPSGVRGGDPACELTGGADCQMTGQVRLQAGGIAPQLTWHGNDGSGTASDFGISKVGNAVEIRANRATHNASIGMDSLVLRGQVIAGSPQNFLDCADGLAGEYCNLLSGAGTGTSSYLTMGARIRNVDGTVAAPAYAFTSETSSGLYRSAASTVAMAIGGTAETVWTSTAFAPGSASGSTLGTAAAPWAGLVVADGAVASPSISYAGDSDTGIYRVGADRVGIVSGGTLALQVGNGTASTEGWVIGTNDSVNVGIFQLPRSVSTTPAAPSSLFCDVTRSGFMTYHDDTDDTVRGRVCVCTSLGGSPETYGWRDVSDMTTAC